jgi:hypothetical protein
MVSSLALLVGYQSVLFAIGTKTFAIREGFVPNEGRMERFHRRFTLERGLLGGSAAILVGLGMIGVAVGQWVQADFGDLDYDKTTRWVIPGATLTAFGFETIFSSFFISILNMLRR